MVGVDTISPQLNLCLTSPIRHIIGIVSQSAVLKLIYSLSVVERAISICTFEAHKIGQPEKVIKYPDRDFAAVMSLIAVTSFQLPTRLASAQTRKLCLEFGCKIKTLSQVPMRYLPICLTASAWDFIGFAAKQVH